VAPAHGDDQEHRTGGKRYAGEEIPAPLAEWRNGAERE
jgi:hypothetical protein